jgi:hypothetical protein
MRQIRMRMTTKSSETQEIADISMYGIEYLVQLKVYLLSRGSGEDTLPRSYAVCIRQFYGVGFSETFT